MSPRNSTILCVDDIEANLELLESILVSRGYTVVTAAGGQDALSKLKSQPIDLVLLDVMMPGMNGFDVCRQIKGDQKLRNIPVILITALSAREDRIRGIEAGAEEFLSKPLDQTEALARIRMLLKVKEFDDDRRRAEEALQLSNDRLREVEALRDSLVDMVVHDLRNPLTAIVNFAHFLETADGEHLSEKGRGYVGYIIKSADVLTEMCSSMLDVSKMESGQLQLKPTTCDLGAIAREVVSRMDALKGECQIALTLPEQPVLVRGEAQLLSRLLQNLVGNALKFVPGATGRVDVGLEQVGERVRCTIRDNGPGIPPEHQEKVFDKFWQGEARQQGVKYSSGLGLTFCKMVVEAHGGRIGVESAAGTGSVFWFELPQVGHGDELDGLKRGGSHDGQCRKPGNFDTADRSDLFAAAGARGALDGTGSRRPPDRRRASASGTRRRRSAGRRPLQGAHRRPALAPLRPRLPELPQRSEARQRGSRQLRREPHPLPRQDRHGEVGGGNPGRRLFLLRPRFAVERSRQRRLYRRDRGRLSPRPVSALGRLFHQSSHLGDEYVLSNEAESRVNLSYQAVDLRLSYEFSGDVLRLYVGGEDIFEREPATLKPLSLQSGLEFRSPWPGPEAKIHPIAAADARYREENDWAADVSLRAGIEFKRWLGTRNLQLLLEYFTGHSPNGQFYTDEIEYLGLGVHFNF